MWVVWDVGFEKVDEEGFFCVFVEGCDDGLLGGGLVFFVNVEWEIFGEFFECCYVEFVFEFFDFFGLDFGD